TGFYTHFQKLGKNNDPEQVFTVRDGMIHVSGTVFGYLATEKEYENYHLVVEFKWGERTGPRRKDQARDSGGLLDAVGPDGRGGRGEARRRVEHAGVRLRRRPHYEHSQRQSRERRARGAAQQGEDPAPVGGGGGVFPETRVEALEEITRVDCQAHGPPPVGL